MNYKIRTYSNGQSSDSWIFPWYTVAMVMQTVFNMHAQKMQQEQFNSVLTLIRELQNATFKQGLPSGSMLNALPDIDANQAELHGRVVRFYCNIRYPDGKPFEGDSRLILQRVMEKAAKMGFDVKIGTECEFYLFKLDEKSQPTMVPHDNAGYCDLAPSDKGENVRRDIILTLLQMGIEPETSHHEAGPGQNEIDFKYNTAVKAADNFATFKTAVKTIAAQDGLFASFMLFLGKYAVYIPMAVLAAVLVSVSWNMAGLPAVKALMKGQKSDICVFLVTFLITVFVDLTVAIEVGLLFAAFFFIKKMIDVCEVHEYHHEVTGGLVDEKEDFSNSIPKNVLVYEVDGPLFFGTVRKFELGVEQAEVSYKVLVLQLNNTIYLDAGGIQALLQLKNACDRKHVTIILSGVLTQPYMLLEKMGVAEKIGRENIFEGLDAALAHAGEISVRK